MLCLPMGLTLIREKQTEWRLLLGQGFYFSPNGQFVSDPTGSPLQFQYLVMTFLFSYTVWVSIDYGFQRLMT